MRARVIVAAGVLTAALAACSDPQTESRIDEPAGATPELAMPGSSGRAVASDIEVHHPAPEMPAPVQTRARPAQTPQPSMAPGTTTEVASPEPEALATMPQPTVVATASAPVATVTQPAQTHDHSPEAAAGSGPIDGSVDGTMPSTDRGPMIMIRGGTGGANDPCVIHHPGGRVLLPGMGIGGMGQPGGPDEGAPTIQPGDAGVMVNDRAPRIGVGGKYPATTTTPTRRTGGTAIGGTRGMGGMGGRSRGGIR